MRQSLQAYLMTVLDQLDDVAADVLVQRITIARDISRTDDLLREFLVNRYGAADLDGLSHDDLRQVWKVVQGWAHMWLSHDSFPIFDDEMPDFAALTGEVPCR